MACSLSRNTEEPFFAQNNRLEIKKKTNFLKPSPYLRSHQQPTWKPKVFKNCINNFGENYRIIIKIVSLALVLVIIFFDIENIAHQLLQSCTDRE